MPIREFDLDLSFDDVPEAVTSFLAEAERRIDHFYETEQNRRYPRFVPSLPGIHYAALDFVTRNDLPLGRTYCEWGSGFGVGTCLASLLGYEAFGVEIEPHLVEISERLAADIQIPAHFIRASYFPEGFDSYEGIGGEVLIEPEGFSSPGSAPGSAQLFYEGMDMPIEEIDLFYVYPRPGQQELMLTLFDAVAGEGAILISYHAENEICGYRRTVED